MTRQGLPAAKTSAGRSRVTTLPAPITLRAPMLTPGLITAPPPIQLEKDATAGGMGLRCKRFAMIVDEGVVKALGIDEKGVEASSAERVLEQL